MSSGSNPTATLFFYFLQEGAQIFKALPRINCSHGKRRLNLFKGLERLPLLNIQSLTEKSKTYDWDWESNPGSLDYLAGHISLSYTSGKGFLGRQLPTLTTS